MRAIRDLRGCWPRGEHQEHIGGSNLEEGVSVGGKWLACG